MAAKTCAACDYPLDENTIKVKIGARVVEVCCDECAEKLSEAAALVRAETTSRVAQTFRRTYEASRIGEEVPAIA